MKVLFAGPSLAGSDPLLAGIELRAPARQGDIATAVDQGVKAIGLVDGYFEQSASVWHKEILFALDQGVWVLGASSMGALRAAECAPFGMIPIGTIANAYASGLLIDDADVALVSGPPEIGSPLLTEPLVNAFATIERLGQMSLIDNSEQTALRARAQALHFTERSVGTICEAVGEKASSVEAAYQTHRVDLKLADTISLIQAMQSVDISFPFQTNWEFNSSAHWRQLRQVVAQQST